MGSRRSKGTGILFSFETDFAGRVKARPADRNLAETVAAGLHASRDSFYRIAGGGRQRRAGVIPLKLLPRRCPGCGDDTIIGHGRRRRQAHDDQHELIWIRRGICPSCRLTFTILPRTLAPSAIFRLRCRQLACDGIAGGESLEQAVPHCQDPHRLPDPSTLRRWVQRRLLSVACWLRTGVLAELFLRSPTILAWDLAALCRILPIEASSP